MSVSYGVTTYECSLRGHYLCMFPMGSLPMGVPMGITTYVLMYTHSRSMSQLCHLLSIFILTLSMFPFSGKDRDTSASDRRISMIMPKGLITLLPLKNHSFIVLLFSMNHCIYFNDI